MRNIFKNYEFSEVRKRMSQGLEYHAAFTSILSGEKIMKQKSQVQSSRVKSIARTWIYAPVIATSFLAFTPPTQADISNSATASGTYSGNPVTSVADTVDISVFSNPVLNIVKTVVPDTVSNPATVANGAEATITDALDTLTYHYVITNNGNTTLTNVTPVDAGPSFGVGQIAGTNGPITSFTVTSGSATNLAPGAAVEFDGVYVLSALDVYRSAGIPAGATGVNNTASAAAVFLDLTTPYASVSTSSVQTFIEAGPLLQVTKAGSITAKAPGNVDANAEVGDTITYTYTVFNNGNVPISNVVINDTHEGSLIAPATLFTEAFTSEGPLGSGTADATPGTGSWDVIQPGATVTFTYVHTVTQTEVDGG